MFGELRTLPERASKAVRRWRSAPPFSDKSYAGVPATTKRTSLSLCQPLERKVEESWMEPYTAWSGPIQHGMGGLRHALKMKVRPSISSRKDRLDTFNQLFDCTAASEFKPDDKKPGGQHQNRQAGESQKGSDKKRDFRASISEPAENTWGSSNISNNTDNSKSARSRKSNGGSCANLAPLLWLSKEVYECRKASCHCTLCGSRDHMTYHFTNYGNSNPPEQNSINNSGYDGRNIKCQKAFDTQQQRNESTSLSIWFDGTGWAIRS